jgi:hypothetical protein
MNRNNIIITCLTLSAALLVALNWLIPTASAQVSVKERDYQVVTAGIQSGGDALYILDSRSGQVGVFTYDPSTRGVVARRVRSLADAFAPRVTEVSS